jgi:pyruvate/2-oxoglutarate dehydrogenase complex dihydrolipoamide acyltransferase (E2) component
MPFSVVMPALEMAQESGKLIAWRKREGDPVTKGEPLLEIETDKAVMEIEAPADGILAGVSAGAGTDIPVGQTIAWIVAPGEQPPSANEAGTDVLSARTSPESRAANASASTDESSPSKRAKISPKARRLAKELGVDISKFHGSGPGGEILASDVQAAAAPAPTKPAADKNPQIIDATFTISNLGIYRVDAFSAIIIPPQAAILAVGSIADRVVAVAGQPTVRPRMTLTLSSDHRVIDGARAALFISDLAASICDPQKFSGMV